MNKALLHSIEEKRIASQKQLAILIDPDDVSSSSLKKLVREACVAEADLFFVGGSLLTEGSVGECIQTIKEETDKPVVIFPGSVMQVHESADAILFLSLISGRNPELLIGQQVLAAPRLSQMNIEVMPTGYLLVNGGKPTTASYISNTEPIPHNKPSIAACTALAGAYLGLQLLYLDTGSGAENPVSAEMIRAVRKAVDLPIIVGGGIRTATQARKTVDAGADIIVIGTAFEEDYTLVHELSKAVHAKRFEKIED